MDLGLTVAQIQSVRNRRPYKSTWTFGYLTKGGSYIVATPGNTTDSGDHRDLLVILPTDLGHGRVVQLYIGVAPGVVNAFERFVR